MYVIYFWHSHLSNWVEFIPEALKLGIITPVDARNIETFDDIESVAALISYLGDQTGALPPSSCWKVIGPPGITMPRYVGATYEIEGQETDVPPKLQ